MKFSLAVALAFAGTCGDLEAWMEGRGSGAQAAPDRQEAFLHTIRPDQGNIATLNGPVSTAAPSAVTPNAINAVVNAASYARGAAPGAIATIFGTGLGGAAQVALNARPVQVFFNNDTQINFLVPPDTPLGTVNVTVVNGLGVTPAFPLTLLSVQPGIFYDTATGYGSVLVHDELTQESGAHVGDVLQVYATGLGPVRLSLRALQETTSPVLANLGGVPATVLYSGTAPGFPGLYQVNVLVPAGAGFGPQDLTIFINGVKSNTVTVRLK